MALASELNIYEDTYQFVRNALEINKQIPKMYKPTLGRKMVDLSLDLFGHIESANRLTDKTKRTYHQEQYLIKINTITAMLRLCKDYKLISDGLHSATAYMLTTLGKQMTAWKNHR